jgi:hypothetical protein
MLTVASDNPPPEMIVAPADFVHVYCDIPDWVVYTYTCPEHTVSSPEIVITGRGCIIILRDLAAPEPHVSTPLTVTFPGMDDKL